MLSPKSALHDLFHPHNILRMQEVLRVGKCNHEKLFWSGWIVDPFLHLGFDIEQATYPVFKDELVS